MTDDWLLCNATIPADTDVAGIGIIASFILTAWTTNIIALIPAWAVLRQDVLGQWPHIEGWRWWPPRPSDRTVNAAKQVLRGLCDLQLLTGLSIIIAGFASLSRSTLYHQQMAMYFWWLTLNSFWVARIELDPINSMTSDVSSSPTRTALDPANPTSRNSDTTSNHRDKEASDEDLYDGDSLRSIVRLLAVLISVVLGMTYQSLLYFNEDDAHWDWQNGERCFIYHDASDPKSVWLWVAGLGIYVIALGFVIVPKTRPLVSAGLRWQKEYGKRLWRRCKALIGPAPRSKRLRLLVRRVLGILTFIWLGVLWTLYQFLAVWSYGDGWYPILLLAFYGFAGWTTYDILDQKLSNLHLVEDVENSWGFGQVLPMMLLSVIILQFLDAFNPLPETSSQRATEDEIHLVSDSG